MKGLVLGPALPPMDEPSGGTLRFSGHWILTNVFVTQAYNLTADSSISAFAKTSPESARPPTYYH
jgi:hypothetical protein